MEEIAFRGEKLKAVRINDDVWVWVRPMCDALGVHPGNQLKRLADPSRWPRARTKVIAVRDPIGRRHSAFCIELDSAHRWLFEMFPHKDDDRVGRSFRLDASLAVERHFIGRPMHSETDFYEGLARSTRTTSIRIVAMHLGLAPKTFLAMLRLDGLIKKTSTRPLPSHLADGHFVVEGRTTRVTGKGMAYLFKRYHYRFDPFSSMEIVRPNPTRTFRTPAAQHLSR